MLTEKDVVPYLLRRGLLQLSEVVGGDVVVVATSRRNRHYRVVPAQGTAFLLKQGSAAAGVGSVAYEATVYDFLARLESGIISRGLAPVYSYDQAHTVLTLEYLHGTRNLREHHVRHHRFPVTIAAKLGILLAELHASAVDRVPEAIGCGLDVEPPLVLSMHDPSVDLFETISAGNVALIRSLQQFPEMCRQLDGLRESWAPQTVVHGDLRWDNCLLSGKPWGGAGVKLVDWEFARVGSPAWDVGYLLGEYLGYWVLSMPAVRGADPHELVTRSKFAPERFQPALRSFWAQYAQHAHLESAEADALLVLAVRFAAARLVELACEQMHPATELTASVVLLLQLAMNLLDRPEVARVELLGLPAAGIRRPVATEPRHPGAR